MTTKVLKVLEIELLIQEINPPNLVIKVKGEVTSGGWTNARLVPYIYIAPPVDGIYEFDFVADAPGGIITQPIASIDAKPYTWEAFPEELKGVKVYASSNNLIEKI
ncbi:hypothetical protein [Spongiimicrobium sp. 2-473A-2-J]|uniref:hypothetical protein n=1 Tax=Eudoraea algarum TaxID=3417568 RepID=UPI003D35E2C2